MEYLASDRIAIIDLASGEVTEEELDEELVKEHIGGAGINLALYEQYQDDDPIVIGCGLLTGTMLPGSALGVMTAKSPLTGKIAHAPLFLDVGMEIKYSGFDYIVIKGEAADPVYLWIHDGIADINDAGDLWGRDVWTATDSVRDNMGDPLIQVMAIGPAGEKGSDLAALSLNYWGGGDRFAFGQLLGKKKVKLIALRGMGLLEVADTEGFMEKCGEVLDEVKNGAWAGKQGLPEILTAMGDADAAGWLAPRLHRHRACFNTPYATSSFLFVEGDPTQMTEPAEKEPGYLLNDAPAVLALKGLGLSPVDAGRVLMACAKAGLDSQGVAGLSAGKSADDIIGSLDGLSGATAPQGVFSPWCPSQPLFADFGASDEAWWNRRQAVAYVFGLQPMFALMSPEITEELLLELANLGTELDLTQDTLDAVVGKIVA